jgi:hypothetical protein
MDPIFGATAVAEHLQFQGPAAASHFVLTPALAGRSLQEQVLSSPEVFSSTLSGFNSALRFVQLVFCLSCWVASFYSLLFPSDETLPPKSLLDYEEPLSILELFNLFYLVVSRGGYNQLLDADWSLICVHDLQIGISLSWPLRDAYERDLL